MSAEKCFWQIKVGFGLTALTGKCDGGDAVAGGGVKGGRIHSTCFECEWGAINSLCGGKRKRGDAEKAMGY